MRAIPTASQTVGPFFAIGLDWLTHGPIAATAPALAGVVRDGDGLPVRDAVLEIWSPPTGEESVFMRVATDDAGRFCWPLPAVPPPHFGVLIFMRGLLRPLLTRVYLPGAGLEDDAVWSRVPPARRATLAARACTECAGRYTWDVTLQDTPDGMPETVFFDCGVPSA
ncbi:MAG: protocatechuate 3,4-dioxygenase subunit alpha [Gammaproteobacteria bacterium]